MRSVLSEIEGKLLEELKTKKLNEVVSDIGIDKGTAYVHLWNVRKKYDAARAFIDQIEGLKDEFPNIDYHLRRKEWKAMGVTAPSLNTEKLKVVK